MMYTSSVTNMKFQFHKVRLKGGILSIRAINVKQFQFHKVRLKAD